MSDPKVMQLVPKAPRRAPSDIDHGNGGGDDGGMEARLAKLEAFAEHSVREMAELRADVREIKRDQRADFKLQFGALIAATVGLAGLMAKGFGWL